MSTNNYGRLTYNELEERLEIQKKLNLGLIDDIQKLESGVKSLTKENISLRGKLNCGAPSYDKQ